MIIKKYGWIPDIPDQRDFLYSKIAKPVALPTMVDLRQFCSPVENQKNLGSCTANALVGTLEFLENKDKLPFINLSRLFIYYNERAIEHTVNSDSGATLRDGIKSLAKLGVCPETDWKYIISKFKIKPSKKAYADASQHKIVSYHRILTLDDIKNCLAQGYTFVFGFTVYESFESEEVARTGIVNMPQPDEAVVGGHAVAAIGYDDSQSRIIVRNSWGPEWGMNGYFTMPYNYLTNPNLAGDMWVILRSMNL